jgi:signal peptidase I
MAVNALDRRLVQGWALPTRFRKALTGLLALALLAISWLELGPAQLGGRTSYVMTEGTSMLPSYRAGDVVVLRRHAAYRVGQVAGYRNPELHTVVMHRVVAVHGDRYEFKGDNNGWRDSYQPAGSEIVGAEWFHVHGGAGYVMQLRRPIVAAVMLGLLFLFSFSTPKGSRRRRRSRRAR